MVGLNLALHGQKVEANCLTYVTGSHYLIPWNRVIEKLKITATFKQTPTHYGTYRFFTVLTSQQ